MHEFGHALYERQIAPELARTNLGDGHVDVGPRVPEQAVGEPRRRATRRSPPCIAAELAAGGVAVDAGRRCTRAGRRVRPSLIRVSADQLTYPLHIVMRFELERALIEGTLAVADLPAAWNDGMRRLLGVEVPDDAHGVLQDIHWAAGAFGYFPSYALGLPDRRAAVGALESELGAQDDALRRGDVEAIRAWLGEHVHRHGRRLDTEPLVERVTGGAIDAEPFLRYASAA